MRIDEIIKDPDIYPRVQISQKAVESYTEAIKSGAKFPPIITQEISYDDEVMVICLDGWHRIEAYKAFNRIDGVDKVREVETTPWQDKVLDKNEHLVELMIKSYELNARQGLGPTKTDAKYQLEKIAKTSGSLNLVWKDIAKTFEITPEWASECVARILAGKRMTRDAFMYRLSLLGWTQKEIGEVVGLTSQSAVSESIAELNKLNSAIKSDFYEKQKTVEVIAEYYHLDLSMTWAILLEGKDDIERFVLFGEEGLGDNQPKLSDYWKFSKGDPRLGTGDFPGKLYGQELLNIIYRYSKQEDLVVDPMVGGGTTTDACLILNRKCRAYDVNPDVSGRLDIIEHDVIKEGFPARTKGCKLIILDPPYYKKKEPEYGSSEFSKDRGTFMDNITKLAQASYQTVQVGGFTALLYGQYLDYDDELKSILTSDLCRIFEDIGFRCILKIQSPLTFDIQYQPYDIERAKEFIPWRILPVSKDWQIFVKTP